MSPRAEALTGSVPRTPFTPDEDHKILALSTLTRAKAASQGDARSNIDWGTHAALFSHRGGVDLTKRLSHIKLKMKQSKPESEYVKTMEEGTKKAMEEIKKQFPHFDLDATEAKEPQPQQSTASTSAAVHPAQVQQFSLSPQQQPFLTPSSAFSLPPLPFYPPPLPSYAPISYSHLQPSPNAPTYALAFYPPVAGPAFPSLPQRLSVPRQSRPDASTSSQIFLPPPHTIKQPSPLTKTLVSIAGPSSSFSASPPFSNVETRSIGVGTSPSPVNDQASLSNKGKKRKPLDAGFWKEGSRILKRLRRKLDEPIEEE
jgi:hypothetical protein